MMYKKLVFQIWMDFKTTTAAAVAIDTSSKWVPKHTPSGSLKEIGMPVEWQSARRYAISKNPTWTFALISALDARSFLAQEMPRCLSTYDAFPHDIQRVDFIRVALLYVYGGTYFDLDYEVLRPLDTIRLMRPIGLIASGNVRTFATNSIMISAVPRHPFWMECIREMSMRPASLLSKISRHALIMESTGPGMVTRVWKRHPHDVQILDVSVPCSECTAGTEACTRLHDGGNSFVFRPLRGMTWHAWDSKAIQFVLCHWRQVAGCVVCTACIWKLSR
jgi:hypothetical protein